MTKLKAPGIQCINEWVERRRRESSELPTGMNAERFVKVSRVNIPAGTRYPGRKRGDGATQSLIKQTD